MEIRKAFGYVAIIAVALTVWVVVTWAVVAPPDRELPVEVPVEVPKQPVHTVRQSIIGCNVIMDNIIVNDEEYFLALCNKPKRIESAMLGVEHGF